MPFGNHSMKGSTPIQVIFNQVSSTEDLNSRKSLESIPKSSALTNGSQCKPQTQSSKFFKTIAVPHPGFLTLGSPTITSELHF